jgi:hypothetical protein
MTQLPRRSVLWSLLSPQGSGCGFGEEGIGGMMAAPCSPFSASSFRSLGFSCTSQTQVSAFDMHNRRPLRTPLLFASRPVKNESNSSVLHYRNMLLCDYMVCLHVCRSPREQFNDRLAYSIQVGSLIDPLLCRSNRDESKQKAVSHLDCVAVRHHCCVSFRSIVLGLRS